MNFRSVRAGLDVLLDERLGILEGRRIGFVTNQTSISYDATSAIDALLQADVNIISLFAPEHGIRGDMPDGEEVISSIDRRTGLPIKSLYGAVKKPTPDMLREVDLLLFDIQDVGARFYTFISTMAYSMQACSEQNIPFVVLDRPNPIGGAAIEGPTLGERFASFVGLYPIPIRYGMSIGELALYISSEFGINADIRVVPMQGWKRGMWFDETGLTWVPPSKAMLTLDTVIVYPGICLCEGTNLSEGRGTSNPFELVGAPWIDGTAFADALNQSKLPGVHFETAQFVPASSKYAGDTCLGVRICVTDRDRFQPVLTGVKIIELAHRMWPKQFLFRDSGADDRSFFDLLVGTDQVRLQLMNGKTAEEIAAGWRKDSQKFEANRARYLLY